MAFTLLAGALGFAEIAHADVNYFYDPAGRISGAVDNSSGASAQYNYDAAGNVVSIARPAAGTVSIVGFTPTTGLVGTTVTIYGTGFSTTPNQNSVTFNGVAATVISATATQIVTQVPTGATTGPISVTSPNGSATSSTPFTVGPLLFPPTITGFTPTIGVAGTAVTINGTNFNLVSANNRVRFNITSATVTSSTATQIQTQVPSGTGSGPIQVMTGYGTATSSADFFVLPAGYTAAQIGATGRIAVDGSSGSFNTQTASTIALILFNGIKGQTLGLGVSGVSTTPSGGTLAISVLNPNGSTLVSCTSAGSAGNSCDLPKLPATGTYTIMLVPSSSYLLAATLTLSSDVAVGTLATGAAPLTFATTRVGQNARFTFSGTAGQNLNVVWSGSTFAGNFSYIYVYTPDGTTLSNAIFYANGTLALSNLPFTGTYTVFVTPCCASTGQAMVGLNTTGSLTVDGAPSTFSLVAGQNGYYTFSGSAGQTLGLGVSGVSTTPSGATLAISVLNPNGSTLMSCSSAGSAGNSCDLTLPSAGTYTVVVTPSGGSAANFTLTLSNDVAGGTLATDAAPLTFATTRVGQNARFTFSGTAGQNLGVVWSGSTFAGGLGYIHVYKPDGTTLSSAFFGSGSYANGTLALSNLPASGTYTVFVTPCCASTGQVTVGLNATGSLTVDGAPSTFSLVAGQNGYYTFSGSAGQTLGLGVSGVSTTPSGATLAISVLNPNGSTLVSCSSAGSAGNSCDLTLPSAGTYTVVVTPSGGSAANFTLTLSNDVAGGTLATDAAPLTFATTRVGQNARFTFSGTAGQNLGVVWSGSTFAGGLGYIHVYKPDGTTLSSAFFGSGSYANGTLALSNLPASGTYTVFVTPCCASTGQAMVGLNTTGSLTVDGAPSTFSLVAGQNGYYTFSGSAGQTLGLGVSGVSTTPSGATLAISVLNPNGSTLMSCSSAGSAGNSCDLTLPSAGTYTVVVTPSGGSAANFTLTLSNDVAGGTLATDAAPLTFATTRVGQNARFTFSGTAGQNLGVVWSGSTFAGGLGYIHVYKPDGTTLSSAFFGSGSYANGTLALSNLPASGTYTVFVTPCCASTGQVSLGLQ